MSPTWSSTSDWDAAQSETGVHHEQPADTDWAASDVVEKGYPTTDEGGSSLEYYYPLDDASTPYDDVTSGHDLDTITGTTTGNAGIFGNDAVGFDGTDDNAESPSSSTTLFDSAISFSGWFYWTNTGINAANALRIGGGFTNAIDDVQPNHFDQIRISYYHGGTEEVVRFGTSAGDTWKHIGFTHDGTTAAYYEDGSQADTASTAWGGLDNDYVQMGRGDFAGRISDVRVYSRALSSSEMSDLYQAAL